MKIINFLKVGFLSAAITLAFIPVSPSNASVTKSNYNFKKNTVSSYNIPDSNMKVSSAEKTLTNILSKNAAINQHVGEYKVSRRRRRRRGGSRGGRRGGIRTRRRSNYVRNIRRRRR